MKADLSKTISIILVEPQSNENLGAVARAMHNFGHYHLYLVSPAASPTSKAAQATAHGSQTILQNCRIFNNLKEAISNQQIVIGTTQRYRKSGDPIQSIKMIIGKKEYLNSNIALVFGSEKSGLSNDDLKLCDFIYSISIVNKQPSLNLAQAVILCLYEMSNAASEQTLPSIKLAAKEKTEMLKEQFISLLEKTEFNAADTIDQFVNLLFRSLKRAYLEERDVNAWLKFVRHMENKI